MKTSKNYLAGMCVVVLMVGSAKAATVYLDWDFDNVAPVASPPGAIDFNGGAGTHSSSNKGYGELTKIKRAPESLFLPQP